MMYISQNAPRIARALFEIALRRGWSSLAELMLTMSKVNLIAHLIFDISWQQSNVTGKVTEDLVAAACPGETRCFLGSTCGF